MEAAEGLPEEMAADAAGPSSVADPWFPAFAQERGVTEFSRLLTEAGLQSFVESSDHPLTIFAPSNEAIMALGGSMPSDMQCIHTAMPHQPELCESARVCYYLSICLRRDV